MKVDVHSFYDVKTFKNGSIHVRNANGDRSEWSSYNMNIALVNHNRIAFQFLHTNEILAFSVISRQMKANCWNFRVLYQEENCTGLRIVVRAMGNEAETKESLS